MHVRVWDGTKIEVTDREEGVRVVKEQLKGWMEKGDRLTWDWSDHHKKGRGELPNLAFVVNELGEHTDAHAVILS